jgi:hypothetical protein
MSDDFTVATAGGSEVIRATALVGGQKAQHLLVGQLRRTPVGPPEKLTVGTGAVVGLTPPATATHGLAWVETNTIRYYEDGTNPTSVNGPPVLAGEVLALDLASFSNFKMIGVGGTATVHVLYWKFV